MENDRFTYSGPPIAAPETSDAARALKCIKSVNDGLQTLPDDVVCETPKAVWRVLIEAALPELLGQLERYLLQDADKADLRGALIDGVEIGGYCIQLPENEKALLEVSFTHHNIGEYIATVEIPSMRLPPSLIAELQKLI